MSWSTALRAEKKDGEGNISKKRFIDILKRPEENKYPLKKMSKAAAEKLCEMLWLRYFKLY
ncbi:MAG: hypothetical protein A2338_07290 [Bacteroidetes bacterium RIFOXYB12_FULL_41_6]|nr:MAG: hypothetical protein A2338_07290 [Bacteroidetes bacterium RIFOXYB12_FULL_41_6]